jgi:acyl carrier protein
MNASSDQPDDIEATIERLIRDIGRIPPSDIDFSRDAELFDSGYIESLGIIELTSSVESFFHITLTEEDLFDARFATIRGIAEIIVARCKEPQSLATHRGGDS